MPKTKTRSISLHSTQLIQFTYAFQFWRRIGILHSYLIRHIHEQIPHTITHTHTHSFVRSLYVFHNPHLIGQWRIRRHAERSNAFSACVLGCVCACMCVFGHKRPAEPSIIIREPSAENFPIKLPVFRRDARMLTCRHRRQTFNNDADADPGNGGTTI